MRIWWTLVRRELGSYFVSWTGYVVIAVVLFLFGISFSMLLHVMNGSEADKPLTEMLYEKLSRPTESRNEPPSGSGSASRNGAGCGSVR